MTDSTLASNSLHRSSVFNEILVKRRFQAPWQKVGSEGLEDIPLKGPAIDESLFPQGRIVDLKSIGRTLIYGDAGFYLYDGTNITYVAGSERLTTHRKAYDLSSIRHAVISVATGAFDLSPDGILTPIADPALQGGLPLASFFDWPNRGVALVSTPAGVSLLDDNLHMTPLPGGEQIALGFFTFVGLHPDTGEVLLADYRGLSLAIPNDPVACGRRAAARTALPESNLCLRQIPSTMEADIGFAIGGVREAPWSGILFDSIGGLYHLDDNDVVTPLLLRDRMRQVTGDISSTEDLPALPLPPNLPKLTRLLAVLSARPNLLATSAGLVSVGPDGQAHCVTPAGRAVRALGVTASGTILAGGDDGLFRVDGETATPWPRSEGADLGQIRRLVAIKFARITLVDAQNGLFAIGPDDVLRRADGISRTEPFTDLISFENARRVMTTRGSSSQSLLLELGLRDGSGDCTVRLGRN